MRRLALPAAVYAVTAALVLPSSPLAAETESPATTGPATTQPAPPDPTSSAQAPTAPDAQPQPSSDEPAPAPAPVPAAPEQTPSATPAPATTTPAPVAAPSAKAARPRAHAAVPGSVTIKDFAFGPSSITVDVGDSVTWTNSDKVTHTASGNGGAFDTGNIEPGASGSATFDKAGSFSYICKPHPFMKGTVVVRAASSGGGDTGGNTNSGTSSGSGTAGTSGSGTGTPTSATPADSGPSLPRTGVDALAIAGLGLLLLALGTVTRRRAAEQPTPRCTGW